MHVHGQVKSDSLLEQLYEELFPFKHDTNTIKISAICGQEYLDTDRRTFRKHPDFYASITTLRKIMFTKDTALTSGLMNIRDEFELYFRNNWEFAFDMKHGQCRVANENLQILQCIEETVLSLNFAYFNLKTQELFEQYLSIENLWYQRIYDKRNGRQAFEDFKFFSPYYRQLLKNRIGGVVFNYNFIEPYINDLKRPLKDYLQDYFSEQRYAIAMEVPGFILYRVLNVVQEGRNNELLNELAMLLLESENMSKTEVARNAILILKKSPPDGIFERKISEQLFAPKGTYKMNALLASSYIYKSDFTDNLITLFDSGLLSDDERNYMKRVLGVIYERAYTTDVQRHEIEEILDKE